MFGPRLRTDKTAGPENEQIEQSEQGHRGKDVKNKRGRFVGRRWWIFRVLGFNDLYIKENKKISHS